MKKIVAGILMIITMMALCACGTTEKWLLTREVWNDYGQPTYTYSYDGKGDVTEVQLTEEWYEGSHWLSIHMKNKKIDSVESNGNELFASHTDGIYKEEILLDGNYEFTLSYYIDGTCFNKEAYTTNEQGRVVYKSVRWYGDKSKVEIDYKYDANNILVESTFKQVDWDTGEVLDKETSQYYCTYDSNGMPAYLFYVGNDEPVCQFMWNLAEIKRQKYAVYYVAHAVILRKA